MENAWKVKITEGYEKEFEGICETHGIYYKPYPKPIVMTYRAECSLEELLDLRFGNCIQSIEEMPMVVLDW